MPTEERYIKFNFEEVRKAISIYAIEEDSKPIPSGTIESIKLHPEDGTTSILCTIIDDSNDIVALTLDQKFFVMALVYACQAHNIPLPRNSKKLLSFSDDMLIMKIDFSQSAEN